VYSLGGLDLSGLFTGDYIFIAYYLFENRPVLFPARSHKRRPNLALVFYVYFVLLYILLRMHDCFCCVIFSFSISSQEIGWEECLRNDLFCVIWDVKP